MSELTRDYRLDQHALRFTVRGFAEHFVTEREARELAPAWSSQSLSELERRVYEWMLPFVWLSMPAHDPGRAG